MDLHLIDNDGIVVNSSNGSIVCTRVGSSWFSADCTSYKSLLADRCKTCARARRSLNQRISRLMRDIKSKDIAEYRLRDLCSPALMEQCIKALRESQPSSNVSTSENGGQLHGGQIIARDDHELFAVSKTPDRGFQAGAVATPHVVFFEYACPRDSDRCWESRPGETSVRP